ncbi:MAG TPA: biopolymer transporter ExbD [Gemmatimonadales bacterium]|nr:biopolymer transporter ExbD [Gemmatimonadales bacterium]
MAGMDVGTSGGFKREPNVVPMIDILLVLLIIFMMQIPLQRKVMDVQVPPQQEATQEQIQESTQIVLELREDGSYAINNQQVPKGGLDAKFHEIYDNRPAKLLFVKVAGTRKYQEVIEAMDIARGAGVQVIGITPPEEKRAS